MNRWQAGTQDRSTLSGAVYGIPHADPTADERQRRFRHARYGSTKAGYLNEMYIVGRNGVSYAP